MQLGDWKQNNRFVILAWSQWKVPQVGLGCMYLCTRVRICRLNSIPGAYWRCDWRFDLSAGLSCVSIIVTLSGLYNILSSMVLWPQLNTMVHVYHYYSLALSWVWQRFVRQLLSWLLRGMYHVLVLYCLPTAWCVVEHVYVFHACDMFSRDGWRSYNLCWNIKTSSRLTVVCLSNHQCIE